MRHPTSIWSTPSLQPFSPWSPGRWHTPEDHLAMHTVCTHILWMGSVVWVVEELTRVESQTSVTDIKSCLENQANQGYSVSRMVVVNHISWILVVSRLVSLPNRLPASLAFGDPDFVSVSTFWGPWLCASVHIGSWWELLGRKHDLGHQWPTGATSGYKLISGRKGNDRREERGDINRVKINQNIGQIRFPEVCWRSQLTLTSHLFPPFGDPLILPSQPHHPDHLHLTNYQNSAHRTSKSSTYASQQLGQLVFVNDF